jgi:hypothetical protein
LRWIDRILRNPQIENREMQIKDKVVYLEFPI